MWCESMAETAHTKYYTGHVLSGTLTLSSHSDSSLIEPLFGQMEIWPDNSATEEIRQ